MTPETFTDFAFAISIGQSVLYNNIKILSMKDLNEIYAREESLKQEKSQILEKWFNGKEAIKKTD